MVYQLIWQRFVASQMLPAIFDQTTIDISAGDYTFRATGSVQKFDGFLRVYQLPASNADRDDDEKDDDGQEPGRRLQVESGDVVGKALDDADGDEPGHERGAKGASRAGRDRPLVGPPGPPHVGRDGGKHENAFEPFTEDQHRNVEDTGPEIPVRHGVGNTSGTQDLQHQDGRNGRHAQGETEREDSGLRVCKTHQVSALTISDRNGRI